MHENEQYTFESGEDSIRGSFILPSGALVSEYLAYLGGEANKQKLEYPSRVFFRRSDMKRDPFISVVTRTQGKRLDELEEMLLCLSGQSDIDFELILVGHNISGEQAESVYSLITAQPEWLQRQILFIAVEGGSRARPLNAAFAYSSASYITILDDDDIVFDNWVEVFHKAAQSENGKILHSFVFTQKWLVAKSLQGDRVLAASGSPEPTYCEAFDYFSQLSMNKCPTMGLAYPRFIFSVFSLTFDESLTTTEDWDFLMRAYPICGVFDIPEPVAIYRLWESNESSHALHDDKEWEANRTFIQEKFNASPVLLPSGKAEGIVSDNEGYHHYSKVDPTKVYIYTNLEPGNKEHAQFFPQHFEFDQKSKTNILVFQEEQLSDPINTIILCPYHLGMITLEDFKMMIDFIDGSRRDYTILDFQYSGASPDDTTLALFSSPPQMVLMTDTLIGISSFTVSYKLRKGIAENMLAGTRIVVRIKEKIRRLKKKLRK